MRNDLLSYDSCFGARATELREDMSSVRKCLRLHVPSNAELGAVPFIFVTCDAASLARGFFPIDIHFSLSSSKWCGYVDGEDYREICQVHMCNIFESFYLAVGQNKNEPFS